MPHRISVSVAWDPRRMDEILGLARAADEAGVETLWVNEGFGHDAFSGLALLARETARVRLGTSIVNVFSRTPGALAQSFATLDQLSRGRAIVGLGTSAPGVIERFHGLPYARPLARLRETVALLRAHWRRERIDFAGEVFHLERGLAMGVEPVQALPPVFLATLHPASVRLTTELADGWLPAWIPLDRLPGEIARLRSWARKAGRDAAALTVRAPGSVIVVDNADRAAEVRRNRRQQLAFFVARNGEFYYRQFVRHGLADEAAAIRRAWDEGGAAAGIAAADEELAARFDFAGTAEQCVERIEEQAAAGVDLHQVAVATDDPAAWRRTVERLIGG